MPRTITAADRSRLIRLASTMEKGSPERKAILAALGKKGFDDVPNFAAIERKFHSMLPKGVKGDIDAVIEHDSREALVTATLDFDLRALKTPKDVAVVVAFLMNETQEPTAEQALRFMADPTYNGYGHPILEIRL